MNKTKTPTVEWHYVNAPSSSEHMQTAYNRLFDIAWQRLLEKYEQQHITLWITNKDN